MQAHAHILARPPIILSSPRLTTYSYDSNSSEPAGAASGVAYLMTLVLSSKSVDPKTLAPEGTVLNAKKVDKQPTTLYVHYCVPVFCSESRQLVS